MLLNEFFSFLFPAMSRVKVGVTVAVAFRFDKTICKRNNLPEYKKCRLQ